jgi:hypothetical protein
MVSEIVFCAEEDVPLQEERLWTELGLPPRSLDDCPYATVGPPERMARLVQDRRRRLGLSRLLVSGQESERFCREVVPLLDS